MKYSIVIPTFNSKSTILETIDSALSQAGGLDFEVVVDDNCSKDGTVELIEQKYKQEPRMRLIKNREDLNIPNGWNRALAHAQGDFLVLLHSDNLLHTNFLSAADSAIKKYGCRAVYTECHYFEGETPENLFQSYSNIETTFLTPGTRAVDYVFRFQRMIPTSCLLFSKECLKNRVAYQPKFQWDPDIDWMCYLAMHFPVAHLLNSLCAIRTHSGQVASWKSHSFAGQYSELLQLTNRLGRAEPYQLLITQARSHEDVFEKLSLNKIKNKKLYFNYYFKWLQSEWNIEKFFIRCFLRKVKKGFQLLFRRFA